MAPLKLQAAMDRAERDLSKHGIDLDHYIRSFKSSSWRHELEQEECWTVELFIRELKGILTQHNGREAKEAKRRILRTVFDHRNVYAEHLDQERVHRALRGLLRLMPGYLLGDPRLSRILWRTTAHGGGASADTVGNSITISRGRWLTAELVHEFGHHIDARNHSLSMRIRGWTRDRVKAAGGSKSLERRRYGLCAVAGFYDTYVGRCYNRSSCRGFFETIPMGLEPLFNTRRMFFIIKRDPEHFLLTWALCRGLFR